MMIDNYYENDNTIILNQTKNNNKQQQQLIIDSINEIISEQSSLGEQSCHDNNNKGNKLDSVNHEREFNQIQSSLQYCNDNLNKTKKTEKKISRISSELLTFVHPNNNSSLTFKTQDNGKKINRFNIL